MSQQKCSRCFGCVGKQWCCNTLNVHLELFHPGTLLLGVGSEVRACGHRETLEASLGPPHSGNRMGVPSGPRPQVLLPGPDRLPCPHTYGWLSPAAQNLYFHPFRTSLGFTPVLWGLPELIDPWRRCCLGWDLEDRKVLFWQRDTGKEARQVVVGLQRDHHLALTRPHCLLK